MKFNGDMTIREAIEADERSGEVFMGMGMHCLGCAMAHGETVAEAAQAHGYSVDDILDKLNALE